KLTTPVAVPLIEGGFASLMTVYGSIAAPDAIPASKPSTYGGNRPTRQNKTPAGRASSTVAPPAMTGLRLPMRSEMKPSRGHPMIQPSGNIDERMTADPYSKPPRSCRYRTPHTMAKMVGGV